MEGKKFDLEDRTLEFSKRIMRMTKALPKDTINGCYIPQCVRASSSVGANYKEANDALGKKDFLHRLRIARKEAKESIYWISLIIEYNEALQHRIQPLLQEATELKNILSSIINKTEQKDRTY